MGIIKKLDNDQEEAIGIMVKPSDGNIPNISNEPNDYPTGTINNDMNTVDQDNVNAERAREKQAANATAQADTDVPFDGNSYPTAKIKNE